MIVAYGGNLSLISGAVVVRMKRYCLVLSVALEAKGVLTGKKSAKVELFLGLCYSSQFVAYNYNQCTVVSCQLAYLVRICMLDFTRTIHCLRSCTL